MSIFLYEFWGLNYICKALLTTKRNTHETKPCHILMCNFCGFLLLVWILIYLKYLNLRSGFQKLLFPKWNALSRNQEWNNLYFLTDLISQLCIYVCLDLFLNIFCWIWCTYFHSPQAWFICDYGLMVCFNIW